MPQDKETIEVYDSKVEDYINCIDTEPEPALLQFIQAMPSGGTVLDLGCGPGLAAAVMAQAGLIVQATDASIKMVEAAAKNANVCAWQQSFDELDAQQTYDGIYANFSLLHAPKAEFPKHLKACYNALKSNALLHLGLKLGEGEIRDSLGRQYTYYREDELNEYLTKAGFSIESQHLGEAKGLSGSIDKFILISARKSC